MMFILGLLVGGTFVFEACYLHHKSVVKWHEMQIRCWRRAMTELLRDFTEELDKLVKEKEEAGDWWKDST